MEISKPYPSDVTNEEGTSVAPYLTLLDPQATQRRHNLWEVFNAAQWIVRAGSTWRILSPTFPL